jgi:hypothetical protein
VDEEQMVIAPAGWFDDPTGLDLNRWWNGTEWTEHTSPRPAALVDSELVAAGSAIAAPRNADSGSADPRRADPRSAGPLDGGSLAPANRATVPEVEPLAHDLTHTYVPFGDHRSWQGHVAPVVTAPMRWNTPGAIAVAFTPLVGLIASVGVVAVALLTPGAWWWSIGAALLPLLWTIAFAVRDRKKLEAWGYDTLPSLGWLLLGPLAYLIARTVRVHQRVGRGSLALWLFIINSVLVSAVIVALGVGVGASLASRGTAAIEQRTESEFRAQGRDYSVVCPSSLSIFVVGSTFDCAASDSSGIVGTVTVKITGTNGTYAYLFTPSPTAGT